MSFWYPVEEATEGAARLLIPVLDRGVGEPLDHARSRSAVFYNPVMRLNRDTAVLAVGVEADRLGRAVECCEPMCGTGVRGVRLALETGARVLMGDLNPSGVALSEENARRNGVSDRVVVREMDANLLMNLHAGPMNRLDYMDVDPYGSPAQFLDSAFRATRDGGLVALTATDMAPLCGVSPAACIRKYGGRPLRTAYTHEVALRLLLGAAVRAAAIHELGATPLFSYYADHYIRAYLRVVQGAKPADASLADMGYVVHCPTCLHRVAAKGPYLKVGRTCPVCGSQLIVGGPMWLGRIAGLDFTSKMRRRAAGGAWDQRLMKLLENLEGESDLPPTFFNLDELSSRTGSSSLSMDRVMSALRAAGFDSARTHFDPRGIRTTATAAELTNVIKS